MNKPARSTIKRAVLRVRSSEAMIAKTHPESKYEKCLIVQDRLFEGASIVHLGRVSVSKEAILLVGAVSRSAPCSVCGGYVGGFF